MADGGLQYDPWQASLIASTSPQILVLCSRQSGKSTTSAAKAIKAALEPDSLVLLLSPTQRQSGELFRDKVRRIYNALGCPVPITQESALQMTLANGSRIVSLPGEEGTVRGYSSVKLLVIDEASRVPDELYRSVRPMLAVSRGQLVALSTPFGKRGWFYQEWTGTGSWERISVTADQCPRIPADFLAEERRAMGEQWFRQEYLCEFTDGGEQPLFPFEWLDRAARLAEGLIGHKRVAKAIGCDPAEGGDRSAWAVVDEFGLIHLVSMKTPDTTVIPAQTIALMKQYHVPPERVAFDRGGGGKQAADRLREMGYPGIRTVPFGETLTPDPKRGITIFPDKLENREEKYAWKRRRDEMYWQLRHLLDPSREGSGFALPAEYTDLRRQLAPIPLLYDGEGRMELPPKNKKDPESKIRTLVELIGHSPDEADSLVLAIFAMLNKGHRAVVSAI